MMSLFSSSTCCILFDICKLGWVPNSCKWGAYYCANVGYLREAETMRYQGNPAAEQRKADAMHVSWVLGLHHCLDGEWKKFSLRELGIIYDK